MFESILLNYVVPTVATIIGGFLINVLSKVSENLGITIDAKEQKALIDNITRKVMTIEEMNAWNVKVGNKPISSERKMDFVKNNIFTEIKGKIPKVQIEELATAIIAGLPKFGATK